MIQSGVYPFEFLALAVGIRRVAAAAADTTGFASASSTQLNIIMPSCTATIGRGPLCGPSKAVRHYVEVSGGEAVVCRKVAASSEAADGKLLVGLDVGATFKVVDRKVIGTNLYYKVSVTELFERSAALVVRLERALPPHVWVLAEGLPTTRRIDVVIECGERSAGDAQR